ncbi:hypothetical protein [Burkholderia gladioli]|uniref:hypothetical protein n=1 Tax=Burkholderia gladioli TaxID=28095 RepID=UPI00163F6F6E|nr:hypothetical protein [Burkholderia gladioli]
MSVHKLPHRGPQGGAGEGAPVDGGGGGGDDDGMEARIQALETANKELRATFDSANKEARDRLIKIETRLDAVATKADLNQSVATIEKSFAGVESSLHALTWKIIGACGALVAVAFYIAKHVT